MVLEAIVQAYLVVGFVIAVIHFCRFGYRAIYYSWVNSDRSTRLLMVTVFFCFMGYSLLVVTAWPLFATDALQKER